MNIVKKKKISVLHYDFYIFRSIRSYLHVSSMHKEFIKISIPKVVNTYVRV